uniref:Alpha-glucosidase n=1 Tax=Halisarca dujardinii TaxID=2583056 RepID=A0AA96MI42_HALDU|nr:alpha-glucosidase [Halisarca dujardinii]
MKTLSCIVFASAIALALCLDDFVVPPADLDPSAYPEWAHYHWVWLDHSRSSQDNVMEYVNEYKSRNITVGAVNIDSGWSTGYNNFIVDTKKFPNASNLVDDLHKMNIRVILWATSVVDTTSSNYQEAHDKGYFLKDILGQQAIIDWWHGKGGMVDYTNPDAVKWWHGQMDKAIELGIDGWKCDGTDPYVLLIPDATGKSGHVTRRQYSDAYYEDFFDYIRSKTGRTDKLIMSRPVDEEGPIYLKFSPKRVMISGWVGDQDPTFEGLQGCLRRYLQSAWAGYANFGSDIGGYRSGNGTLGRSKELFIRWAQLGAFSPLMENGGNKEHRPWMFDTPGDKNETANIYRKLVDDHYQLIPYFLTIGSEALRKGTSSIHPLAKHDSFINKAIDLFHPSTFNYLLGSSFLVVPISAEGGSAEVTFPDGHWVARWNTSSMYKGGETASFKNLPLEIFPVFLKTNGLIPLRITPMTPVLGKFPCLHDKLRFVLHRPSHTLHPVKSSVIEDQGTGLEAYHWMDKAGMLHINATAHPTMVVVVEIHGCQTAREELILFSESGHNALKPSLREEDMLSGSHYFVSKEENCLFINLGSLKRGAYAHLFCDK